MDLAEAGGIDRARFDHFMSGVVLREWELWELTVKQMQRLQDDLAYEKFERFANQEIAREEARRQAATASEASGEA